jgi:hypothetical protein
MPTGCGVPLTESTTPERWFIDPNNGAGSTCSSVRLIVLNTFCSRTDGYNRWGLDPEPGYKIVITAPNLISAVGNYSGKLEYTYSVTSGITRPSLDLTFEVSDNC